ncbi:MAG: ABC transporter ATP-binding protein [Verrucomicrobiales bacterium]
MKTNAIEIRGLVKKYPDFTLGPVDLTVPPGAIYGFIGPNGAGKTTTIDLIFGMGVAEAGSIEIFGLDHSREEVAVKRQIAYVSPELNFLVWGRVGKTIQFVKGFYPTWDDEYCERLMKQFGLRFQDTISALSFGAKIKLSLLLALSWHPKVLILDEPTVGLDAVTKQQVYSELLEVVKEGDRTVFISSHGLVDLERFTDHIGMIKNGRMLLEGPTSDIVERFQMVDLESESSTDLCHQPGIYPQFHDRNRWRVLADRAKAPVDWIQSRGARQISTAPVSLEELFVALSKEGI